MKIIFLNAWHAKILDPLENFLHEQKNSTDIFCFSETSTDLNVILDKQFLSLEKDQQTIFIKNNLKFGDYDFKKICDKGNIDGQIEIERFAQGIKIGSQKPFSIFNIWGMAFPGDKLDSDLRIKQSEDILNFVKSFPSPHIIVGDFNLMPDTESIRMFEKARYKNLIREFNIKSTRNKIAWEYFEKSKVDKFFGKQHFADYCFVSEDIKVKSFEVPNIEISDHLPLILEFEV